MNVNSDYFETGQRCCLGINLPGTGNRNAKLVLRLPRRDLLVRARVNVGIDPHSYRRCHPKTSRDCRQPCHLGLAFDIELTNASGQGGLHLSLGLTDARKNDPIPREPGRTGPRILPTRDNIDPGAQIGHQTQHRLIGVGLHRIANEVIHTGQGFVKQPIVPGQRRC